MNSYLRDAMRRFYLLLLIAFLNPACIKAQAIPLSQQAEISILTCDSGAELYSLFGHTAIRVYDPLNGVDTVFNFGAFDFSTPNFYLKFIKGDLQYFVTTSTYEEFLAEYVYFQRSVYEQKLNLDTAQKQGVADRLMQILLSDERLYTYKFIDRNCTTMVVDIVEKAIGKPISLELKDAGKTNRKILYGYIQSQFYANLGISIMFGAKTDRELYKAYLPMQFLESLSKTENKGKPLAAPAQIVVNGRSQKAAFSLWDNFYTYGLILLAVVLVRSRAVHLTWLMISGLFGIFLALVCFYSDHAELALNYNAFLFNPFFVPFVIALLMKKEKAVVNLIYICSGMLVLYFLYMLNKPHFLLMLPVMVVNGVILGRIFIARRKSLSTVK